ncbi:MAG: hypothetical protein ACXWD8_19680, partial [Mycobacterium sp.]
IHGELLKLGFEVAQSTVARYMCRHSRPPSQGWRTFLSNHVDGIAAIEPASGVDTELVDSLKALDPERPIREADIGCPDLSVHPALARQWHSTR